VFFCECRMSNPDYSDGFFTALYYIETIQGYSGGYYGDSGTIGGYYGAIHGVSGGYHFFLVISSLPPLIHYYHSCIHSFPHRDRNGHICVSLSLLVLCGRDLLSPFSITAITLFSWFQLSSHHCCHCHMFGQNLKHLRTRIGRGSKSLGLRAVF